MLPEQMPGPNGAPSGGLEPIGAQRPRLAVFALGVVPRAMPDMVAYTFYRFECALRSSAVLGFFGVTTVGYYLKLSFENTHYREVWTHIYGLCVLIIVVEWWSGAIRRRWAR